jgi:biopolymer transport protein ExbD
MKVHIEPDELDVRIELIPLIDIIFCILVFFLLGAVTPAGTEGLNVDLPYANSGKTQFGDTLQIEVDALGTIIVQNTVVSEEQLSQLLALYVAQKPQGVVLFQADKNLNYGKAVELFGLVQKVGGTRVALGTTNKVPASRNLTPELGMPPLPNQSGQLPNLPTVPNGMPLVPGAPTNIKPNPDVGGVPQGAPSPNGSVLPSVPTQPGATPLQTPGSIP